MVVLYQALFAYASILCLDIFLIYRGEKMPNKNIYMDQTMINWIDKKRKAEDRSFSNYVVQVIRKEMEKQAKRGE